MTTRGPSSALVAAALEPVVGRGRLMGLVSSPTDRPVGPSRWASAALDDLAAVDDETVLVLDDLHRVSDTVITETLDRVFYDLPDPVRLVMITRADPTVRLGRIRADRRLLEIRASHLSFTDEESEQLLQAAAGRHCHPTRYTS